jgi:membrane associated rhomboid family serine protease
VQPRLLFAVLLSIAIAAALNAPASAASPSTTATSDLIPGPPSGSWTVETDYTGPMTVKDFYGSPTASPPGFSDAYRKEWYQPEVALDDQVVHYNSVVWALYALSSFKVGWQKDPAVTSVRSISGFGDGAFEVTFRANTDGYQWDEIYFAVGDYVGRVSLGATGAIDRGVLRDQSSRQFASLPAATAELRSLRTCVLAAVVGVALVAVIVLLVVLFLRRPAEREVGVAPLQRHLGRIIPRQLLRYPVTVTIALLCLLGFAGQIANDPSGTLLGHQTSVVLDLAFVPVLWTYEPWRLLTGPFVHVAPWHLLNNVIFLLLLGSWLEEDVGSLRMALLFIAGALAGEAVFWVVDPLAVVIGASGGLMALAAAGIVMERKAPFANQRRRLCVLTIALTLMLGLLAPSISGLPGHVAGAITGLLLGLALPPPIRIRARRTADATLLSAAWIKERASIQPASLGEMEFELRPTIGWRVELALLAASLVAVGASTALQALSVNDAASATTAVLLGLLTAGGGVFLVLRVGRQHLHFDRAGFAGVRAKQRTEWSDIALIYPGRAYSGLFARGGVGCTRLDGMAVSILALGHPVRPLARRLEAVRLAAVAAKVSASRAATS